LPTPTHLAVINLDPLTVSNDHAELAIVTAQPDTQYIAGEERTVYLATDDLIYYVDLDDVPLASQYAAERAQVAATQILSDGTWTWDQKWQPGYRALYAELAPTHGLATFTLLAASARDPLPGHVLGDDRLPTIPGLDEHPGVYAWKVNAAVFETGMVVRVLPAGTRVEGYPTLTVTLPLPEPVYDGVHYTVDLRDPACARELADLLAAAGRHGDVDGTVVGLTRSGVDVLADIDRDDNGHCDSKHVWWNDVAYPLRPLTLADLLASRCPNCGSKVHAIRANVASAMGNPCIDSWHDQTGATA
jgi:hypothetical protein